MIGVNHQLWCTTIMSSLLWLCLIALPGNAKDMTICLGEAPGMSVPIQGQETAELPFLELVNAVEKLYTEGMVNYKVFPFVRSLHNVVGGECDCHFPLIADFTLDLPYTFSSRVVGTVPFVIYSRKEQPITRAMIDTAMNASFFPYKIETDRGHVSYFPFEIEPSSAIEQSLQKLMRSRIDAYIFAQRESDRVMSEFGFEQSIHRELYKLFEVRFVIPKGERGKDIDRILSMILDEMSATGELQRLYGQIQDADFRESPYKEHNELQGGKIK